MTTKGNCSVWEVSHKHNSLSSKGYDELIFILILFASAQTTPWIILTSSVLSKKRSLSVNTTCMVEPIIMSHRCHCIAFLSFVM